MAMLVALTASAQEKWSQWDADFDQGKRDWKEIEAQIPAYPRQEDLLQFEAGGGVSQHRYFIDPKSLSIGEDGVVRYSLVIKTAGGATNISFEGMRCDMQQLRLYAFGRTDGSWSRAKDSRWRRLEYRESDRHHGVLYGDFLCPGQRPVRSVADALNSIRYGAFRQSE
jgi:CNP1-like family